MLQVNVGVRKLIVAHEKHFVGSQVAQFGVIELHTSQNLELVVVEYPESQVRLHVKSGLRK